MELKQKLTFEQSELFVNVVENNFNEVFKFLFSFYSSNFIFKKLITIMLRLKITLEINDIKNMISKLKKIIY